jgi:uncharacterized phage-associated protein
MLNVKNVAHYILTKVGTITTVKLQKLVYYSQAWSLAWDGVPLFNEEFQAWSNGPVCAELFDAHRGRFLISSDDLAAYGDYRLSDCENETIDIVIATYNKYNSQQLSDMTHQERPWKEARNGFAPGERCHNIISKETMQDYYGGL